MDEVIIDTKSERLTKRQEETIKGYDLLNIFNSNDEQWDPIICYSSKKKIFKTFEDVHCEKRMKLITVFNTENACSGDNAKIRSLWFWRILSLFLAIIIAVVYINTSPPVYHVYHRYHKKKFYDYILFFYCDHLPNYLTRSMPLHRSESNLSDPRLRNHVF
ncbi:GfV-B8-ORF1 [Ichnoviriform fumiferanae]|uniref:GfV-B8-ORF1 n=1 Tax=Ichnoviriform fumiferanae TaxID=419435 RepID=A2PZQ8_9VIRU|nr:GfV-B8-ORF1 [Ichnoviriform fumiferanae]BAF45480.1 GfV-B8-ORF1 [Ichnoviriform fumiferanae]